MTPVKQKITWCIVLLVVAIATSFVALPDFFTHPSYMVLSLGGDALKNFYSYYYHCMYDSGVTFTGMNYPYGEHIVYADGQASLSVPISYLRPYLHITSQQIIASLHLAILVGYILGVVYTGLILRLFKVSYFFSAVFAALIILLTPQTFRIFGHYALSYVCVIPMLFYWSILYHNTSRIKFLIYIFLSGVFFAFVHPYFAAVYFIFGSLYILGYSIVTRRNWRNKARHAIPYFIAIISVPVVVKGVMAFTDPVRDRPAEPLGMLSGCSRLSDIFTNSYSSFWALFPPGRDIAGITEGTTYVGVVCAVTLVCTMFYWLYGKYRKRTPTYAVANESGFSSIWLMIAIGSLLLGMGIPFIWNMEWLLDYLSVFRQFRSLGRFSWIFYYIVTIYTAVVLYGIYSRKIAVGKKLQANLLMWPAILLWAYETKGYIKYCYEYEKESEYYYQCVFSRTGGSDWEHFLIDNKYRKDDFQAIMLYPYVHIGTDKFEVDGFRTWVFSTGFSASLQMQLPIVNVMMSRSSWSQGFGNVKMAGGILTDKSYLDKVNEKPFLLIWFTGDEVKPEARYLFDAADYIGEYTNCKIYACYPSRIKKMRQDYLDTLRPIVNQMHGTDTVLNPSGQYFIEHFDTGKAAMPFLGNGAFPYIPQESYDLPDINISIAPDSQQQLYEFSAWALVLATSSRAPVMRLEVYDSVYAELKTFRLIGREATDFNGMWFRISSYLTLPAATRHIRVKILNTPQPSYISLDELLLRPAITTVISKHENGKTIVNGHLFDNKR